MTGPSRRQLLTGVAAAGGAAATGLAFVAAGAVHDDEPGAVHDDEPGAGAPSATGDLTAERANGTEPFHGPHQAGIATPAQEQATFVALDLRRGTDHDDVVRLLRLLSDDAARLTAGRPALADTEPWLAERPARLTVTFGLGPGFFDIAGLTASRPGSVVAPPAFPGDALEERWSGGDVLLQICADEPTAVSHAVRMLTKDARAFATVRWVQRGFRSPASALTQRNLLGQVDGTVNPAPGTADFEAAVWHDGDPGWFAGGSVLVLRRVALALDAWDAFDAGGKELVLGRRLGDGAPLTGTHETDTPDLEVLDASGFPVIDRNAHIRLARAAGPQEVMLRRGYNYDEGPTSSGAADVGLLFAAYQRDASTAFVPVQQRLAASDAMNRWVTHIGSAVFAVPPGCEEGGYVGDTLLGG